MKCKSILLFLNMLLTVLHGYGQTPPNDNYTGAGTLTVNPGYTANNVASGTTVGATQSSQAGCYGDRHDDDVWYKFIATKASHIVRLSNVANAQGTNNDRTIEVFSSLAGVPNHNIHCSNWRVTEALLTGLTIGETYFVRIYADISPARINFNISILTPPDPPGNDEYNTAAVLTANPAYNCSNPVSGTTNGATQSQQASCNGEKHDNDVWYKFTATKPSHIVRLSNITSAYGGVLYRTMEVFNSLEGQPNDRISCQTFDPTESLLTGLTTGETYFVRIYAEYQTGGVRHRINFSICILTPPDPPVNDEYTGAISLTVNPDYNCTNAVPGTTNGATQSQQASCNGEKHDNDVWYKFTATRPSHIVRLSNITSAYGGVLYRTMEVFNSLEGQPNDRISCQTFDRTESLLTGLTTGETYFIRIYAEYQTGGVRHRINFNICILSPIDPPTNNEYASATELTINPANDCTVTTPGTTDGATQSPHDACYTDNNDDVWFTFTATQASHTLRLSNITQAYGSSTWRHVEIFTKVGNVPTARIFCSDNNFTETTLTGLTPAGSYYVRVYTSGQLNRINFNICILTPPVPANDDCTAAVDISNGSQASGTTNGATQSMSAGSCAGNGTAYDVWYKVIPVSDGALTVVANSSQFDLVLEAFTGTCGALTSIACKNDAAGSESLTIANATTGTTYYFRVYNYTPAAARVAAETGAFTIQVSGGALPVSLASFKAYLSESNSVRLDWATTEEAGASHFEVEHSLTGKTWSKIGELKAAGNNTGLKSYTYIHTNPSLSVNYYRLKSVDLDGTSAYSAIENVRPGIQPGANAKALYAYPNPVSDRLYLKGVNLNDISGLKLYSAAGNQVTASVDIDSQSLDVRQLPAGVYLLQVDKADGTSETVRVLISR